MMPNLVHSSYAFDLAGRDNTSYLYFPLIFEVRAKKKKKKNSAQEALCHLPDTEVCKTITVITSYSKYNGEVMLLQGMTSQKSLNIE